MAFQNRPSSFKAARRPGMRSCTFRLSNEEYATLWAAATSEPGRGLSEWARTALLAAAKKEGHECRGKKTYPRAVRRLHHAR